MTVDDTNLRLNSIERFSKKSSRLLLEEHGHCEVPAGCGGVVLRWINPQQARPLLLWVYSTATVEMFIDGVIPESARPLVPPGRRVVGLHVMGLSESCPGFLFAGLDAPKERGRGKTNPTPLVVSSADGTWKYVDSKPARDEWLKLEFDDAAWKTLEEVSIREPSRGEKGAYGFSQLRVTRATPLGPKDAMPAEIWVRKVVDLPPLSRSSKP